MTFSLTQLLILFLHIFQFNCETFPQESFDCNLIRESIDSESDLESFFISGSYLSLKCGIIPASLVNNKESNAKFLIKWTFKTTKSIELEFRIDSVEDYSILNYYYSIRKFNGHEFYSGVKPFLPEPEEINESTNNTDLKNTLLLNVETVSFDYMEEFDQIKNSFIICTIVLNLQSGISFNLPFMCVDVFFDQFYYEKDKV